MRTVAGMALGFSMLPVVMAVIFGFAWIMTHCKLQMSDCITGLAVAVAIFMLGVTTALKIYG